MLLDLWLTELIGLSRSSKKIREVCRLSPWAARRLVGHDRVALRGVKLGD